MFALATRNLTHHGMLILTAAPRRFIFDALKKHDFKLLQQRLKEAPQQVHALEMDRTTPLHYLAGASPYSGLRLPVEAQPPKKFVQLLLSSGCAVNAQNCYGETALHIAASTAYFIMVEELLKKKGINPSIGDKYGHTPLHSALLSTACFDPYFRSESLLLKKTPTLINSEDKDGNTPLLALINSLLKIVNIAEHSGNGLYSNLDRIEHFYINNISEKIHFLLEKGAAVEGLGSQKNIGALELCLRKLDPAPSSRCRYEEAFRPVLAAICKRTKSLGSKDENGWTLLHWAAYTQSVEVAKLLLERGLNPSEKDKRGITPRDLAHLQVNRPLLALMQDEVAITPFSIAIIIPYLPNRNRLPYYWYTDKLSLQERHIDKIFTTGLYKIEPYQGDLEKKIYNLYKPEGKVLSTPMGWALREKNLDKVKQLVDSGWNVEIDQDFLFRAAIWEYSYQRLGLMLTSYGALKEAWDQDPIFYRSVVSYFDSHVMWTGVSLSSELQGAIRYGAVDDKRAIELFEMGLTPEIYKKNCRQDLAQDLKSAYDLHWSNERGWRETEEYPAMSRILEYTTQKGWT